MKKAFSLMEVVIAASLISVVMLSLYKVQSSNIFYLEKSKESKKQNDYISLLMETKANIKQKINRNIYLDNYFSIKDDDIRREFKKVKIKEKSELLEKEEEKLDNISFKINQYKTTYSFDKGITKNIYRFELEL